jgi:hypothetical protein
MKNLTQSRRGRKGNSNVSIANLRFEKLGVFAALRETLSLFSLRGSAPPREIGVTSGVAFTVGLPYTLGVPDERNGGNREHLFSGSKHAAQR